MVTKSKLLALGAVNTTINDQECQHVTGRFESIRMPLNTRAGWPPFFQSQFFLASKGSASTGRLTIKLYIISDINHYEVVLC